jgi:nitrogen regulatory protein P-II 1
MKQITAIIKPFKLEEVREALAECGVTGLTVTGQGVWSSKRPHRAVPRR